LTVTYFLIALNVAVFIWEMATGALTRDPSLVAYGALDGYDVVQNHQYWRIVTGAFLHGGFAHIALNMFALWQLGSFVERVVGGPRMLVIYLVSLLGSGLAIVVFSYDSATVGASGAIFGLFGALVGMGLRLGAPGRSLIAQVVPVIVLNLVFTFAVPNISAAAHVGGLLTGFIVGLIVFEMRPSRAALVPAAAAPGEGEAALEPEPAGEPEPVTEP
jgi:rhomboid protease GluP